MLDLCQQELIKVKPPTSAAQSQTTLKIPRCNTTSHGSNNSITSITDGVLTCSMTQWECVCTKFITYVCNLRKQSRLMHTSKHMSDPVCMTRCFVASESVMTTWLTDFVVSLVIMTGKRVSRGVSSYHDIGEPRVPGKSRETWWCRG